LAALIDAGLNVALYGGYWDKHPKFRPFARGHIHGSGLRKAIGSGRVSLCLVRRANRDGHAMRSFEVPAMRGCPLSEDTEEHRMIFGDEGDCTLYFTTCEQMISKARWLLEHPAERDRLAQSAHQQVISQKHTYASRLRTILESVAPQRAGSQRRPCASSAP
jgi:spore maturation protein CgeB